MNKTLEHDEKLVRETAKRYEAELAQLRQRAERSETDAATLRAALIDVRYMAAKKRNARHCWTH